MCLLQDYSNLDSLSFEEALELVENTRDVFDDVWRQNEHKPYSNKRMRRLMDVIGTVCGRACIIKVCSGLHSLGVLYFFQLL